MKHYPIVKLAEDFSLHLYTGWSAGGLVLIECNNRASAIKHGAAFVRHNLTGVVMDVSNVRQHQITPKYVRPCLACRSLEHITYSRKCEKTRKD